MKKCMRTEPVMKTGLPDVDRYLERRRRTHQMRRHGGPIIALLGVILAALLIWQIKVRTESARLEAASGIRPTSR